MTLAHPSSLQIRPAHARGRADLGWLKSFHSFSFADYYDPQFMGFRSLRVINDDQVSGGQGFGRHPHKDMEIFSYVLSGALEHRDSMGNGRILHPGQIQLMSAGTGVYHSEFNPQPDQDVCFLQIWIQPRRRGLPPSYTEWRPTLEQELKPKVLVISETGRERSAIINQDADVYRIRLQAGESVTHIMDEERGAWVQMTKGSLKLNGQLLVRGDGASSEGGDQLVLTAQEDCEALLFDLA